MKIDREMLFHKSKRTLSADARKIFCFLGCRRLGFSIAQIGRFLGVSLPAVSYAASAGEQITKIKKIELNI